MWEQFLSILSILGTILLILLVFVAAYWCTKQLGKHYMGRSFGAPANGKMKVLAQMPMGNDKLLTLVKVSDQVLLLGVTGQSVSLLKEFPADQFPEDPVSEAGENRPQFQKVFKDALQNWKWTSSKDKDGRGGSGE